jgi:transposase
MPIELPDTRTLPDAVQEALRVRAVRAREMGFSLEAVCRILGVARETVSRWWLAYREEGIEGLAGKRTGRPEGSGRLLTEEQEDQIIETLVEKTPEALGIPSALWSRSAVCELIRRHGGPKLAERTVGDYLARWGFTPQKPVRKSYRQDDEAVRQWLEETYPKIEARAKAEGAEIHWADETGVRSGTFVGRGYAVPGNPPELMVPGQRFTVNMISSITNQGQVRWMLYTGKMTAALFVEFLTRLIRRASCKVFLIVDNLSLHEARVVKAWLAEHQNQIEMFTLPKYSPELNPDEYLNGDLKQELNKEGLPKDRETLHQRLKSVMSMFSNLRQRIAGYFQHPKIAYAAAMK